MKILIRFASEQDARQIAEVHLDSRECAYKGLVPDEHMGRQRANIETRAEMYADRIANQGDKPTLVAEIGDRIAGFAMLGPSRDQEGQDQEAEIEAIYVAPDLFGEGVGRALMDRSLEELRLHRYREVMLWVFEDNPRARRFYEAAGFELDAGRKIQDWGGKSLAAVRYRMLLDARA